MTTICPGCGATDCTPSTCPAYGVETKPEPADMQFELTLMGPASRPRRVVTGEHFTRSTAFAPVLELPVGGVAPGNRYRSAGYRKIKRVA